MLTIVTHKMIVEARRSEVRRPRPITSTSVCLVRISGVELGQPVVDLPLCLVLHHAIALLQLSDELLSLAADAEQRIAGAVDASGLAVAS